jgi:molecular chaperone GrpE
MADRHRDGEAKPDEKEGWEALSEESEDRLSSNPELEEALREASAAVEERTQGESDSPRHARGSADKLTIEALSSELRALKQEYESKLAELDDLRDRHVRLQAEFENFRKRSLRERQESLQYGSQNLVKDLLPTVDNLERAIEHSEASGGGNFQGLLQGVELVLRELLAALEKHGVQVIEAEDRPFDPSVHEAMAQVPDASVPPNSVVQVLQKGYQLRDRMLRPARVVVSRQPEAETGGKQDEE